MWRETKQYDTDRGSKEGKLERKMRGRQGEVDDQSLFLFHLKLIKTLRAHEVQKIGSRVVYIKAVKSSS